MKSIPVWLAICVLPSLAVEPGLAQPAMPVLESENALAKGDKEGGRMVFALMPKSLQREPLLDFNVLTDMTDEGRKRVHPTAEAPQHYMISGGDMKESGDSSAAMKTPSAEAVRQLVNRALARRHFIEAGETTAKPSLAILYHWGTHESPASDEGAVAVDGGDGASVEAETEGGADDLMLRVLGDMRKRKILIDRAALVGGMKFAMELNASMNDEAAFRRGSEGAYRMGGAAIIDVNGIASPFQRFKQRDEKTMRLVEESFGGLFYVIISAFDYSSIAAGKPVLLWRTKMSVNSRGLSLVETIRPLIVAGSDFIGKETDGGILIARRIKRAGSVKIGEAEVVEFVDEPSSSAPTSGAKK